MEFHGYLWHGGPKCNSRKTVNPLNDKTMEELYQAMLDMEHFLKALGYIYQYNRGM